MVVGSKQVSASKSLWTLSALAATLRCRHKCVTVGMRLDLDGTAGCVGIRHALKRSRPQPFHRIGITPEKRYLATMPLKSIRPFVARVLGGRQEMSLGEQESTSLIPKIDYDFAPSDGYNHFGRSFSALDDAQWCSLLEESVVNQQSNGVTFPSFPEEEFQQRVHGHSGRHSMIEAAEFFRFIKANTYAGQSVEGKRVLDFGCGWGRIIRFFMRDFELTRLFGFEPNFLFCTLARTLNPYITFFSGPYLPDKNLPENYFDLIFGWSVFSHISQYSAQMWLREMARILTPGGYCVFTTWGDRFLLRLLDEASRQKNGEDIHWYSALCISKAGSIEHRLEEYNRGEFVWWDSVDNALYGEAFISETALQALLTDLPLRIVRYDRTSLPQDAFVLQKI